MQIVIPNPRVIIVGRSNAGKSMLGAMIAEYVPSWTSVATSDVSIDLFAQKMGKTPEEVSANKEAYRAALISFSEPLLQHDPALFTREALKRGNIINGIRHENEFQIVRPWFQMSVFIYSPNQRLEGDSYDIPESTSASCDLIVGNDGKDPSVLAEFARIVVERLKSLS
jgi:hypothetical protein